MRYTEQVDTTLRAAVVTAALLVGAVACSAFGSEETSQETPDAGPPPAFCDPHHEAIACLDFENTNGDTTRGWASGASKSLFEVAYEGGQVASEERPPATPGAPPTRRIVASASGVGKRAARKLRGHRGSFWRLQLKVQIDAEAPPPYATQAVVIKPLAEGSNVFFFIPGGKGVRPYALVGSSTVQQPYSREVDFAAGEHTITIRRFTNAVRWAIDDDDEGVEISAGLRGDVELDIGSLNPTVNAKTRAHIDDILLEKY